MGARKIETYPIHILSLNQIKVDHSIQSRVETSKEFERDFAEAMLRGDQFPAITVFFDGKYYWLADGFHRYGATKQASRVNPKLNGARAEVRNGTRRDAIIFSAGANKEFSIRRKPEDIKKAVWMLCADKEWFGSTSTAIAKHVGCSLTTANKHRIAWCNENAVPVPEVVKTKEGKVISSTRRNNQEPVLWENKQPRCTAFFASLNGTKTYLGTDKSKAEESLSEIKAGYSQKRQNLQPDSLAQYFMHRGLTFKGAKFNPSSYPGLSSYFGHGVVFVSERFERRTIGSNYSQRGVPEAVGCVLMSRAHLDPEARAVIVCYPEDAPPLLIELARKLGVEFLTPDELVASIKGDEPEAVATPA